MSKVELRKIDESDYPEFMDAVYSSYAEERSIADHTSLEDATTFCEKGRKEDIPQGYHTPGNIFYHIYARDEKVGALWLTICEKDPPKYLYVDDIVIYEPYRRKGYAIAALLEAERVGREAGCVRADLNVFSRNAGAQALYLGLGYDFSTFQMNKVLQHGNPDARKSDL